MKTLRDKLIFDPPQLGTVLWLPGLPGAGGIIYDRSPYGNLGTINGATWLKSPGGAGVLSYNGTSDFTSFVAGTIPSSTQGTFIAWVYPKENNKTFICFTDTSVAARHFVPLQIISNVMRLNYNDTTGGGAQNLISGNTTLTLNQWWCLATSSDGSQYFMEVNGVPQTLSVGAGSNDGKWKGSLSAGTLQTFLGKFQNSNPAIFTSCQIGMLLQNNQYMPLLLRQNFYNQTKGLFGVI